MSLQVAGSRPGHLPRRVYAFAVTSSSFRQVVPRPDSFSAPSYPDWADALASGSRTWLASEEFRARLRSELAKRPAESQISAPPISAAVLIAFFDLGGETGILLTRRAATMRAEPLTISFPGGRVEPDEPPIETAIREAEEEVGVPASMIEVLGSLDVVDRRREGEYILPVVGWLEAGFPTAPNPAEVDAVFEVPLAALLEEGVAWSEEWGDEDDARTVKFFAHRDVLGADLVWGLTARLIWELIERVGVAGGGK